MGQIKIYHDEDDREYTVNFDLKSSLLNDTDATTDFYLVIKTTLTNVDGTSYGEWRVRTLEDVPPGGTTATDFNNLCQQYVDYFMAGAELGQSSSSSSSLSNESSYGYSESSSSYGYSESSSSQSQ